MSVATQAQINANRRNSRRSTGPRTPAGKAASSQNALDHGLYAESIVIDDENARSFEDLQRDYFETCDPQGRLETALVLELVRCDWLTRRTTALETQLWNDAIDDRREWLVNDFNDATPLAHGYGQMSDRLVLIQRRLTALNRAYHRALQDLQRLQAARTKPAVSTSTPPEPATEIGFVPKNNRPATPAPDSAARSPELPAVVARQHHKIVPTGDAAAGDRIGQVVY